MLAIIGGGLAGALVLSLAVVVAIREFTPTAGGTIDVVYNLDSETAMPDPAELTQLVGAEARVLAADGGGTLRTWTVAGDGAQRVGHVSLEILRDGRPEGDERMRNAAVDALVESTLADLASAVPTGEGRSLWSTFAPLPKPDSGSWIIYAVTLGLPTKDPEDARDLTGAEPQDAVDTLPESALADLRGATVHLVLAAPAGDQQMTPATSAWRRGFVEGYIERSGGAIGRVTEIGGRGDAAPGVPSAPTVDPIGEDTWTPPMPEPDAPYVASLDGSALFVPQSDALLRSDDDVRELFRPLAEAWNTGNYSTALCEARAARYGDAKVALELTERRAAVGVRILASLGVPARGVGLGYDHPLPGFAPTAPEQRELRCILLP